MNLYSLLSRRNDLKALLKGRLPQRLIRKHVYRHAFRLAGAVCRLVGVGR